MRLKIGRKVANSYLLVKDNTETAVKKTAVKKRNLFNLVQKSVTVVDYIR